MTDEPDPDDLADLDEVDELADPIAVIARGTGETRDEVAAALVVLGELGYDFDDVWLFAQAAVAGNKPLAEMAANLPEKAHQSRQVRRAQQRTIDKAQARHRRRGQ